MMKLEEEHIYSIEICGNKLEFKYKDSRTMVKSFNDLFDYIYNKWENYFNIFNRIEEFRKE